MAKTCEQPNCQFYHNKRGCPSCVLNPDSYVAELQAKVTRLEGILGGLVLPENYCGSDGREVELIVPIEVYDEACEIALKENEK